MVTRLLAAAAIAANLALPAFVLATEVNMQINFGDVAETNPNAESITYLRAKGIVDGYADGTFKPDSTINRAEFTKIVVGAKFPKADIDSCLARTTWAADVGIFKDVSWDAWYVNHLCVAVTNDVIGGYEDGTFRAGDSINYAEASKIIALTLDLPTPKPVAGTVWYKPYMDGLRLTNALPASFKSESQLVTRGEMAFMIHHASTFQAGGDSSSSSSAKKATAGEGCMIGGCSAQLCLPEGSDGMSTCEYREAYACYQTATCEKQASGQCGWTQTDELTQCLAEAQ